MISIIALSSVSNKSLLAVYMKWPQDETHCGHFDRNGTSFRVTKRHVNTNPK